MTSLDKPGRKRLLPLSLQEPVNFLVSRYSKLKVGSGAKHRPATQRVESFTTNCFRVAQFTASQKPFVAFSYVTSADDQEAESE